MPAGRLPSLVRTWGRHARNPSAMEVAAIVAAAGLSRRMRSPVNKVLLVLGDRPVLAYSLEELNSSEEVDQVVIVARKENIEAIQTLVNERGIEKAAGRVILGGVERFDSVLAGLQFLAQDPPEAVLIHDAARPFLTREMITKTLSALDRSVGAVVALPSRDTVKLVDERYRITSTLDRRRTWLIQTPQTFRYREILEAYREYQPPPYPTDDAFLLERKGGDVTVIQGSCTNIKITTPEDLHLAEAILRMKNR